jgi:hypothetical protein
MAVVTSIAISHQAWAIPFAVDTTARKSVRRPANGQPITALTRDSAGLVFQDYAFTDQSGTTQFEPRFLAFSTQDASLDDDSPPPNGLCSGPDTSHVYWIDDHTGGVSCVSYGSGTEGVPGGEEGNGDSYEPRIGGGPGDEGRYVVFESRARNLFLPRNPVGDQQILIHDRKANDTFLSTSKCRPDFVAPVPTQNPGSDRDVSLWDLSEDGKQVLLSTRGIYMRDNVFPECYGTHYDGERTEGMYVRNGSDCVSPSRGDCYTKALFDRYGLHANSVLFLDEGTRNGYMSSDASTVVFDTLATVPTRFNPDVSGFYDVYLSKNEIFSVISRAQVPRCSLSGILLPITNTNEPANGDSTRPRIDGAGRYVVFQSEADDLVVDKSNPNMICKEGSTIYYPHPKDFNYVATNGFSQVYVYDEVEKKVELVSKADNSTSGGNGPSGNAWISKDGHYIIFESSATNLLAQPTTASRNIFMHDRIQKKTYLVTVGTGGSGIDRDATITHVSKNGLVIAFSTRATDAVVAATNGGANPSLVQHVYIAQNACPIDTDGDGVPDCLDLCPNDLLKTEPGACGCGKEEKDTDKDLVPDCIDLCVNDVNKREPGQCGCGVQDVDTDRDSIADCVDQCPNDSSKSQVGVCGCGVAETDTDGDGLADCKDACPSNPKRKTTSGCSCSDLKDAPGVCGCNVADTDANGNGIADCLDPSANTVPSVPKVDITRTTTDAKEGRYQLVAMLQKFQGKVTYNVTLKRGKKSTSRSFATPFVSFKGLRKGTVVLEYSVSIGSGASMVTSKTTSVTIVIPPKRSGASSKK